MYAGRAVLEGKIPYRDFWDHKGPVIYYLNALGLLLGGGSAAGVWGLELAWAGAASICLFLLLRELGGELAGWAGVLVFLLGLGDALGGGNFVEEYGLLFTIVTLLVFRIFLQSRNVKWLVLCGILTGMAFLLRANLVSAGLGIFAFLLVLAIRGRFSKVRLIPLLGFSAGAAAPILMYSLYMAGHHAFSDMVSGMILYNRTYAGPFSLNVLEDFRRGLAGFPWLGFWIIGGLAAVSTGILNRSKPARWEPFTAVLILGAALEIYLSNISRAGYKHYYISWLPYAACLAAYLCSSVLRIPGRHQFEMAADNLETRVYHWYSGSDRIWLGFVEAGAGGGF